MEAIASADPFLSALAAGLESRPRNRRMLVAVSGGRDSVALLHGLHRLGWKSLAVAHLDHRLRGRASSADARFVARLAEALGYPFEAGRADVRNYAKDRGISIELAAREMRHVFFAAAARRARCRTLLLAHHADDQVETCLFNFLRGSGAAGLAGMRRTSEQTIAGRRLSVVRPLLSVRRHVIEEWIRANRIRWREDATNADCGPARNRLRNRILPALREEFGGAFPEAILRAADILGEEELWMSEMAAGQPCEDELSVLELRRAPLALRRRWVRRWLRERGVPDCGFAETERVLSLLNVEAGPARVNLPAACHARRRAGRIFLERP